MPDTKNEQDETLSGQALGPPESYAPESPRESYDGDDLTASTSGPPSPPSQGILHAPNQDFAFWRKWHTMEEIRAFFGTNWTQFMEALFLELIEHQDASALEAMALYRSTKL